MAEQDLIRITRDAVEAFNAGDWQRYKTLFTADSLYDEVGSQRRIQGVDQLVESAQGWKQAFPDVKGTITTAVASGNTVTLEITWEGTHTGALEGPGGAIPASGKRMVTRGAWLLTFQGVKIKESRNYFDMMSMLQQIGALPQAQPA